MRPDPLDYMPGPEHLGPAEEVPDATGVCLRRQDPVHGYFYYHLATDERGPFIMYRPISTFSTTATILYGILQKFPSEATSELRAMYEYFRFAGGEFHTKIITHSYTHVTVCLCPE